MKGSTKFWLALTITIYAWWTYIALNGIRTFSFDDEVSCDNVLTGLWIILTPTGLAIALILILADYLKPINQWLDKHF